MKVVFTSPDLREGKKLTISRPIRWKTTKQLWEGGGSDFYFHWEGYMVPLWGGGCSGSTFTRKTKRNFGDAGRTDHGTGANGGLKESEQLSTDESKSVVAGRVVGEKGVLEKKQ